MLELNTYCVCVIKCFNHFSQETAHSFHFVSVTRIITLNVCSPMFSFASSVNMVMKIKCSFIRTATVLYSVK